MAGPHLCRLGHVHALLVREDTGAVSEVPFVVTDPTSTAPIVYQTSDATWEAYNAYNPPGVSNPAGTGIDKGNSLYQCYIACPPGTPGGYTTTPATEVSYNRPLQDGGTYEGRMSPFYSEFPMIYFLEENGYDMTYISAMDTDSNPSALNGHQIFISSGHDEYWSGNMRNNVQAAVNHGVNLAFFSGNEVFWKTQFAKDPLDATPDRTMISYKETHNEPPYGTSANQFDPSDPSTWTGTWRDPQGGAPDDAGTPENALTGQLTAVDASANNDDIQVPYQYANLPVWANTSVAQLTPSSPPVVLGTNLGSLSSLQTMQNGFGTLGYEWDADVDNGFRPAGEIDMSSTTDTATSAFVEDYGTNVTNNTTTETHHLSLYRAASGALVFGAGTVQFSWGLDPWNPIEQGSGPADRNMQQFVVNLFAMMGVQPATLISGLVPGAESSSTTPPSSVITSPTNNASLPDGAPSTITGTATTNAPGDVVAGVEVSTDGGTTWHPATLNGADAASMTWIYSWQDAHGVPSTEIESRATDSWGNIEAPTDGITVNISCGAGCSIFGSGYTPAIPDSGNTNAVTVGLKFDSTTYGVVDGISFYKSGTNTGTHVGMLWTSTGTLLAQATFTNETASGWQYVQFSKPVPIIPNTTYVASYYAPNGHNSEDNGALDPNPLPTLQPSNADAPPLHAVHNTPANPDGVWIAGQGFPTTGDINPGGDNFGVDVLFTPQPAPGPATSLTANAGFEAGLLSWNAPTTGGPVTSYTITPYIGSTPQPTTTVTGTPAPTNATVIGLTNGTTYTFTVTASNPSGTATPSAASNPITPSMTSPPVFIQEATAEAQSVTNGISVSPTSNLTAGNRLVVEVVESAGATTNVTDSVGDTFTKLTSVTASNGTQMSIWTAPITNSGGTKPVITATPSTTANMTIAALEYQGLSGAPGSVVLDQVASAAGTTTSAATVQSGPTPPTSGTNEEAIGFYADQGSNDTLAAGSGYTPRVTVAPTSEPEALVEDQVLSTSGTPNASASTGSNTTWMMATVVLKSEAMTPPTLPEAPAGVTATGGDGSAQVSWTPPSNGGALISSYAITPYLGGVAQTPTIVSNAPPVSSTNIGNLTPGASYTFTVAATNTVGTGAQSAPSNAVTVLSLAVPAAPTNVTSTAGNTTAAVSWTAPSQDGGAPITSYLVTPGINTSEGITYLSPVEVTGNPPTTGVTVTGLDNGTTYVFTVQAVNVEGTGASSQSNAVTPGTVPDAPTGVNATLGPVNGDATVVWTPPASNGGSTITSYTVTPYVGSTAEPSLDTTVTGTANSAVVDGLVVGTTYTFNVTATNALGVGPASQQSNQVTPVTAPGVPFAVTATAGTGSVTVGWTAPSNTGGSSISSYTVTPYLGSTAQTPVTVSGSPPATSATLSTLTNGSTYTFTVSATNSAGAGPASATSNLATPEASAPPCPCTVFGSSTPAAGAVDSGDSTAVNVGMAFSVDQPGYITGVRFYKAAANTGTHVGDLWSASGTELAQATFTGETASGWQLVSFSTPVAVSVGTTYVVSYTDPNGHYSATSGTFSSANVNSPPLYGLATTTTPDGLYSMGSSPAFPTLTYQGDNYWVDPVFNLTPNGGGGRGAAGTPTAVTATAGTGSVTVGWTAPSNTGGSSISSYTVTPYLGSTAQTPVTVSGSPPATSATLSTLTNGSTYTFTVSATNSAGAGPASATSNLATPEASAPPCPCTVFGSSTPAAGAVDSGDSTAVNVGMAFSVDQPGYITGVRFYKAAANTGTHVGDLWSASGTELAQATFTGETASGWQLVSFSTPVAVSVGTTYVVSYTDPNGHYSATSGTFSSANVNSPPLYGLATTTTPDGLYSMGSSPAFPTLTYQGDNYWVDPVFNLTPNGGGGGAAGTPTAVRATAGTGSVTVGWTAPSNTGGSSISSYTVTPYLGSTAQTPVTVSGSPPATSATLSTLTNGSTYTFTVSATNSAGAGPASATSNLATPEASAPPCPCTVFGSSTPAAGAVDSGDSTAVNVGMAFSVDQPGYITGVRFYKAAANTGTHVGDLWSASGTELAQATFTGETASGWQLVSFSTPVAVSVGTTYVVSYTDPNGHYSATSGTFSSANVNNPPLYGLATTTTPDGLYSMGSSARLPDPHLPGRQLLGRPGLQPHAERRRRAAAAGAPTAVTATAGTGSVTVGWTAPSNTGGSSISSYTVTPYLGSTAQTPVTVSGSPPATSATLSTLTNGSTYTFTVSATNSAGAGPASATSNLATPEASAPPCPCTVFGSSTPAAGAVDSGDSTAVNVGHGLQRRPARLHHRRALLQGGREHRHPRRRPLECLGDRCSPRPPSRARRPRAGSWCRSRPPWPSAPAPPTWSPTPTPTATTPPRAGRSRRPTSTARRSTGWPRRPRPTASIPWGAPPPSRPSPTRATTTGSTRSSTSRRTAAAGTRGRAHRGQGDGGHRVGDRGVDGAEQHRRQLDLELHGDPLPGLDRPDPGHGVGVSARHLGDLVDVDQREHLHLHRQRHQQRRCGSGVGDEQPGHARGLRTAVPVHGVRFLHPGGGSRRQR